MEGVTESQEKQSLLRRIRGISLANYAVGTFEAAAGIFTGSSSLATAAVHDFTDGGLYQVKHAAAKEVDPVKKEKKRKIGAKALIASASVLGGTEIAHSVIDQGHAGSLAVGAAAVALVANGAAAYFIHGRRHDHNARDTWRHVMQADLPGAVATLGTTAMATGVPVMDTVGAVINTGLAIRVGVQTLHDIRDDHDHSHGDDDSAVI